MEAGTRDGPAEGAAPPALEGDRCSLSGGAGRGPQVAGASLFIVMIALGGATVYLACGAPPWNWIAAAAYCAYAPAAGLVFAVRGCGHRRERAGSGPAADEYRARSRSFWLHLPLVLPAWIAPPVAALGALFAIESMVVLPVVARLHIGPRCPRRRACPWMRWRAGPGDDADGR